MTDADGQRAELNSVLQDLDLVIIQLGTMSEVLERVKTIITINAAGTQDMDRAHNIAVNISRTMLEFATQTSRLRNVRRPVEEWISVL